MAYKALSNDVQYSRARMVAAVLLKCGMNPAFVPLAVAQVAHETGGFNSNAFLLDNNLSGIKFINKPYQRNATRGIESETKGSYYAHFATVEDWARDYIRILSLGVKPIQAVDTTDLAARLKQNHYYEASQSLYATALEAWRKKLAPQLTDVIAAGSKIIPSLVWWLIGAGAFFFCYTAPAVFPGC